MYRPIFIFANTFHFSPLILLCPKSNRIIVLFIYYMGRWQCKCVSYKTENAVRDMVLNK